MAIPEEAVVRIAGGARQEGGLPSAFPLRRRPTPAGRAIWDRRAGNRSRGGGGGKGAGQVQDLLRTPGVRTPVVLQDLGRRFASKERALALKPSPDAQVVVAALQLPHHPCEEMESGGHGVRGGARPRRVSAEACRGHADQTGEVLYTEQGNQN